MQKFDFEFSANSRHCLSFEEDTGKTRFTLHDHGKRGKNCKTVMSPLERSEKDSALQSRNSAEKNRVLPRRNSGEAKLRAEKISRKRIFLVALPKNPATNFQLTAFLALDLRVSKALKFGCLKKIRIYRIYIYCPFVGFHCFMVFLNSIVYNTLTNPGFCKTRVDIDSSFKSFKCLFIFFQVS